MQTKLFIFPYCLFIGFIEAHFSQKKKKNIEAHFLQHRKQLAKSNCFTDSYIMIDVLSFTILHLCDRCLGWNCVCVLTLVYISITYSLFILEELRHSFTIS